MVAHFIEQCHFTSTDTQSFPLRLLLLLLLHPFFFLAAGSGQLTGASVKITVSELQILLAVLAIFPPGFGGSCETKTTKEQVKPFEHNGMICVELENSIFWLQLFLPFPTSATYFILTYFYIYIYI